MILQDFDRLLPLYRYVESGGKSQPLSLPKSKGFSFKPGFTPKSSSTKATPAARELDVDLGHHALQQALYQELSAEFGPDNVGTELRSGAGTKVDVVLRTGGDYSFYEIKTGLTPRACLREAIGQILEYAYWPGAKEPTKLVVCGEKVADKEASEYLDTLRERFKLPLEYQQIVIESTDQLF